MRIVSSWRCKCGARIKVVAEAADDRSGSIIVVCPNCGDRQAVSADEIISVSAEKNTSPL